MNTQLPKAGDLVHVTRAASVQFLKPILFRIIRVLDDWTRTTYDGWCWLDGYELDSKGDAVARRSIFVQPAKLQTPRFAPTPTVRWSRLHPERAPRSPPRRGSGHPAAPGRALVGVRLTTGDRCTQVAQRSSRHRRGGLFLLAEGGCHVQELTPIDRQRPSQRSRNGHAHADCQLGKCRYLPVDRLNGLV